MFLCAFFSEAFGKPRVITVSEITSTGRSILIELGSLDGITPGTKGVFFSDDTIGKFVKMEVARGEAVKVYPNYSLWYFSSIVEKDRLFKGARLGYLSEHEEKKGLGKFRIDRREIVLSKSDNHLARGAKDFEIGDTDVVSTQKDPNYDGEDPKVYEWVDGELSEIQGFEDLVLFKAKKLAATDKKKVDLEANMRKAAFESYVDSATFKEPYEQREIARREEDLRMDQGVFANYTKAQGTKRTVSTDQLVNQKRKGAMWSAGMSDAELRQYIIDTDLASEVKRREDVFDKKMDHEFSLRFAYGLSNAGADGTYNGMAPKSLSIGYETYLKRISDIFSNFTLGIQFGTGLSYYENGGINLRSEEYGARFDLMYYPLHEPIEVKKIVPFVGIGLNFLTSTVENENLKSDYRYQILSVPAVTAGIKYRFHVGDELNDYVPIGIGALFAISYERRDFTTGEVLQSEIIEDRFTVNTITAQAGVTIYF